MLHPLLPCPSRSPCPALLILTHPRHAALCCREDVQSIHFLFRDIHKRKRHSPYDRSYVRLFSVASGVKHSTVEDQKQQKQSSWGPKRMPLFWAQLAASRDFAMTTGGWFTRERFHHRGHGKRVRSHLQGARRPLATCGDLARRRRRAPQLSRMSNSFLTGGRAQQYAPDLTRAICHFARPRCFYGASRIA